jgi:hypothetical protein
LQARSIEIYPKLPAKRSANAVAPKCLDNEIDEDAG